MGCKFIGKLLSQFGYFSGQLGDGRAVSLGEIVQQTATGKAVGRWEIQLKVRKFSFFGCIHIPFVQNTLFSISNFD